MSEPQGFRHAPDSRLAELEEPLRAMLADIDERYERRLRPSSLTATAASDIPRSPEGMSRFQRQWLADREPIVAQLAKLQTIFPGTITMTLSQEEAERYGLKLA